MKDDPVRQGWCWVGFGVTASWPGVTRIHLLPPLLPRVSSYSLSLSLFLFSSSSFSPSFASPFPSRRRYVSTYVRDGSPDNLIRHGDKTYRGKGSRVFPLIFADFRDSRWVKASRGRERMGREDLFGKRADKW